MRLPPRLWKLLRSRRAKIFLACSPFAAIALMALAYPVTNWIGQRAVENFVASLPAHGVPTDYAGFFTPDDDPAADVFRHPAMIAERENRLLTSIPNIQPPIPGLSKSQPNPDLAFAKPTNTAQCFTPPAANEKEGALRLLDVLRPRSERLAAVRDALARPHACWYVDQLEDVVPRVGTEMLPSIYPSQSLLRTISMFASMEARAHLVLGDSPAAAANVTAILDSARHLSESRPTLVTTFAVDTVLRQARNTIYDGVLRSAWTDTQLAGFEAKLAKLDPHAAQVRAFAPTVAFDVMVLEKMAAGEPKPQGVHWREGWKPEWQVVQQRLRAIWREARPRGVGLLREVEGQRTILDHGPVSGGQPRTRFELEDLREFERKYHAEPVALFAEDKMTHEQRDADADGWNKLAAYARTALTNEAAISLLRGAIALERYRLQHGSHPAGLQDLVPAFLPAVPVDPFAARSLGYERMADGSPRLWSFGENLTDEGGLPNSNREKGDWVWITKPIPGFKRDDYIKQ